MANLVLQVEVIVDQLNLEAGVVGYEGIVPGHAVVQMRDALLQILHLLLPCLMPADVHFVAFQLSCVKEFCKYAVRQMRNELPRMVDGLLQHLLSSNIGLVACLHSYECCGPCNDEDGLCP